MAGGTVAETLILEMDARDAELQAKIARLETQLGRLQKQGAPVGREIGVGAEIAGQKYAVAGRQVAAAAETIARTGKVAGEVSRNLLAHGANMAFMFGPQGAIAGGVAITTLAIVHLFQRSRQEMEETRKKFSEELAEIARAGDFGRASALKGRLFSGDIGAEIEGQREGETSAAFLARSGGLQAVRARLEALAARRAELIKQGVDKLVLTDDAEQNRLFLAYKKLIEEQKELQAMLPALQVQYDRVNDLWKKLMPEAAGKTESEIEKRRYEQRDRLIKESEVGLAKLGGSMKAELEHQIAEISAKADELYAAAGQAVPDVITRRLEALKSQLVDVTIREAVERELRAITGGSDAAIGQSQYGRFAPALDLMGQLDALRRPLRANLETLDETSDEYEKQVKLLRQIDELWMKLAKNVPDASKGTSTSTEKTLKDWIEISRTVENVARGTLQLAEAFGLVDENSARSLQNIIQIGANIPAAAKALSMGSNMGIAGAGALMGVLGGVAGLIGGFFGDSPADRERKRVLQENTRAIRELTRTAGHLSISGTDFGGARRAVGDVLTNWRPLIGSVVWSQQNPEQMDLLKRVAAELGITLDGTRDSFLKLQEALNKTQTALTEFADDFEGRNQEFAAETAIYGDKGPAASLARLADTFGSLSPALQRLFEGLDPSTAEGRTQLRKNVEALFELLRTGGPSLSQSDLGGLTKDQLLDLLQRIIGYVNEADTSAVGGTGGYGISREVTEVTGSRLAGLLTAANAFHERTALAVEALVAGILGPIQPPGVAGSGGVTIEITIGTINIGATGITRGPGPVGEPLGPTIGRTIAQTLARILSDPSSDVARAIDRTLGARTRARLRAGGDNLL